MMTCPICLGLETKQNYREGTWKAEATLCLRHSEELLNE